MMKKKERIRICGARGRRLYRRVVAFIGMTALYSLAVGVANDEFSSWLVGLLILLGGAAGLIYGYFKTADKRAEERAAQIGTEAIELYPEAPSEELFAVCTRLRRKELRAEALLYLLFAAAAFGWSYLMYKAEAEIVAVNFGILIVTIPTLIISAALFVASLTTKVNRQSYLFLKGIEKDESLMKALLERSVRRDNRRIRGQANIVSIPEAPSPDQRAAQKNDCALARSELRDYMLKSWLGFGFFVLFPLVPFVFILVSCIMAGEVALLLLFFGIITAFSVSIWFYLEYLTEAKVVSPFRLLYWWLLTKIGACRVSRDTVLSVLRYEDKAKTMELCFDAAGTYWVNWRGSLSELRGLVQDAGSNVKLIKTGKNFLTVVFALANGAYAQTQQYKEESAFAAKRENASPGRVLSDREIEEEVQTRLSNIAPDELNRIKKQIREYLDLSNRYADITLNNGVITRAEEGEFWSAQLLHNKRICPDYELGEIESAVMSKLNASRGSIASMKKNPFAKSTLLSLVITAVIGIGGIVGTAAVEKSTGAELGALYVIFSAATGSMALVFGNRLMNMLRFRKLQRAYRKPEYQEKLIEAEMYKEILRQVESEYER